MYFFFCLGKNPITFPNLSKGEHRIYVRAFCIVNGELKRAKSRNKKFDVPY